MEKISRSITPDIVWHAITLPSGPPVEVVRRNQTATVRLREPEYRLLGDGLCPGVDEHREVIRIFYPVLDEAQLALVDLDVRFVLYGRDAASLRRDVVPGLVIVGEFGALVVPDGVYLSEQAGAATHRACFVLGVIIDIEASVKSPESH